MKFIKRHIIKLILLVVFLIVFIVALVALLKLLYPDSRKDEYGNRLTGIENVIIEEKVVTEIKDKISASDFVLDIEYSLKGRLVNFTIYVTADTDKNTAKNLVTNITDIFGSDIQEFYDVQVIIVEDKEESTEYPIFAYKHKSSKEFIWTNN